MKRVLTVLVVALSMLIGNAVGTGLVGSMNKRSRLAKEQARTKARALARKSATDLAFGGSNCPRTAAVKFANASPTGAAISFDLSCDLGGNSAGQCAFLICQVVIQLNPATGQYVELTPTYQANPIQLDCGVSATMGGIQAAGPGSGLGPGTYVFSCGIFQMLAFP